MSIKRIFRVALVAVTLNALPASAAPIEYWCFLIGGDRDNSVCVKQRDKCELGAKAARQLGSSTSDCTHYDTVWSTRYRMGEIDADWFYVTRTQCQAMRELFHGTPCQEKR